jgi:WD40 repeat protein
LEHLDGEKSSEFIAHSGAVNEIRFNTRQLQMATYGNEGNLKLWDTGDLSALPVNFSDNGGLLISMEFSPDGDVISHAPLERVLRLLVALHWPNPLPDSCNYITRTLHRMSGWLMSEKILIMREPAGR